MPLARAREKARAARERIADGGDPLADKRANDLVPTFGDLADQHIATMGPSWRNPKHRAQWEMTLKEYAKPLRGKPVNEITTALSKEQTTELSRHASGAHARRAAHRSVRVTRPRATRPLFIARQCPALARLIEESNGIDGQSSITQT